MAPSGLIRALTHPALGALISAADGKHQRHRHDGRGDASERHEHQHRVPGGLSLPSKSVGGSSLAAGAASANVGPLSGDATGTLPSVQVVSIANLVGMDKLPRAGSDAAAGKLSPPVAIGSPYLNTTSISGISLLCIRTA